MLAVMTRRGPGRPRSEPGTTLKVQKFVRISAGLDRRITAAIGGERGAFSEWMRQAAESKLSQGKQQPAPIPKRIGDAANVGFWWAGLSADVRARALHYIKALEALERYGGVDALNGIGPGKSKPADRNDIESASGPARPRKKRNGSKT